MYDNEYIEDGQNNDMEKRERKKKRHRRPKEENQNEQEMFNGSVSLGQENRLGIPEKDDYIEPNSETRRKHRHRKSRTEDDIISGNVAVSPSFGDEEEDPEEAKRQRKEKRRRDRERKRLEEEQYQNMQSPTSEANDYPFETAQKPYHPEEEDLQYDQGGLAEEEGESIRDENNGISPPPTVIEEPKPKKKSGGFGKIFASFKKRGKGTTKEAPITGQWQSNPEIFNPAYDSQPGTLEKSKKKIRGKSARDIPIRKCNVILLDGEEVEVEIDVKATGSILFDKVCHDIDLIEKDFFGMTYVNSKLQTWFWLEVDKKISKQLGKDDEWTFNFQVKFYPPEPVLLQEDLTRYLLSLQVRQDVYTGKLPCSWITQALLGSFMVQSELGDYDKVEHGDNIDYIREFEFVLNQSEQLLEKIAELHKKHIGMSPDKSDIKYMETAKRLEQYGVDLHPARDNDDVEIFIGISYQGILIYRDRLRIGRFAWPKVLRISYKKNYFYLKIRSDRYDDSVAVVGFKLFNHNLAKRLWKNAAEQHTFFRMKEPQMHKSTLRLAPATGSNFGYSGKTLHQYRTMNITRTEPAHFDRSVNKRRTIGSMPAGLNRAGMQYNSMHSLNRAHPRDMTLGKTKSIEHLSSKKPGSMMVLSRDREGSHSSINFQNPQPPYPGSFNSSQDEDRHQNFHSGDSLNGGDSYMVNHDDQLSLPPMAVNIPQDYNVKPIKKHRSKTPSIDVLSDDGVVSPPPSKQNVKVNIKAGRSIPLPLPPDPHSSDSDIVESIPKPRMKKSHQKSPEIVPGNNLNLNRPMPQFKPPPPPPDSVQESLSISSSVRSSKVDQRMPLPPPPIELSSFPEENGTVIYTKTTVTTTDRSRAPQVKPKPAVKPKPNVVTKERTVVTKITTRHQDDESSNDDML